MHAMTMGKIVLFQYPLLCCSFAWSVLKLCPDFPIFFFRFIGTGYELAPFLGEKRLFIPILEDLCNNFMNVSTFLIPTSSRITVISINSIRKFCFIPSKLDILLFLSDTSFLKGQTLLHKKHFANTINTKEGARFLGLP